jgi:hypothetical protein
MTIIDYPTTPASMLRGGRASRGSRIRAWLFRSRLQLGIEMDVATTYIHFLCPLGRALFLGRNFIDSALSGDPDGGMSSYQG